MSYHFLRETKNFGSGYTSYLNYCETRPSHKIAVYGALASFTFSYHRTGSNMYLASLASARRLMTINETHEESCFVVSSEKGGDSWMIGIDCPRRVAVPFFALL